MERQNMLDYNPEHKKGFKESVVNFVKEYKTEIVIGSLVVIAAVTVFVVYKGNTNLSTKVITTKSTTNFTKLPELVSDSSVSSLTTSSCQSLSTSATCVDVRKHARKLAEGYHPSVKKMASASANGFELGVNETWVTNYEKCYM